MGFIQDDVIYFAKRHPDAIIPSKRPEDGCYDVYARFDEDGVFLAPGSIKLVGTGISSAFSPKYRGVLKERGSTGSIGLAIRCGVIDSGYRGEWFVALNNTSNKIIVIDKNCKEVGEYTEGVISYPYEKAICQVGMEIVPDLKVKDISLELLLRIPSIRGDSSLGSSGK